MHRFSYEQFEHFEPTSEVVERETVQQLNAYSKSSSNSTTVHERLSVINFTLYG